MSTPLPAGLQKADSRSPITYSKVLVVEGMTAFQLFKALIGEMGLLNAIEIRNFGGITDFAVFLEALIATPGFVDVVSIGIIRDAEDNAINAFTSICNSLTRAGLDAPEIVGTTTLGEPKVSIFILPDCESPGMLETLCMRAIGNDAAISCIAQYLDCLTRETECKPNPIDKAQVQAFLASRPRPGLLLGEAAHAGYLLWNDPAFDPVKNFLQSL